MRPSPYQRALAAAFRLYPFYSGTASIANHPLFKKISGPTDREDWATTPGGEIYASLGDYIGRVAFFFGDLDPKLTWIATKLIKRGDTVLDIGANLGILTLHFADLVGEYGRVHAFEPNPIVMHKLRSAVARKGTSNVNLNEIALGQEAGFITLKIPRENHGEGSIVKWRSDPDVPGTDVALMRLDDYVSENRIDRIDFLKIDVEGAELEVFRGARMVLEKIQPNIILFEHGSRRGGPTAAMQMLASFGYQFLSVSKGFFKVNPTIIRNNANIQGWDMVAAKIGNSFQSTCDLLSAR
jgi:FkbM family methyltransferase